MDLSKVPDLELRQKIKPLSDRIDEIEKKMEAIRERHREEMTPLREEHDKLADQLGEMLDEREIVGICDVTGLPVFDTDETNTRYTLACVA